MSLDQVSLIEDTIWEEGATTGCDMFPECYRDNDTYQIRINSKNQNQTQKQLHPQRMQVLDDLPSISLEEQQTSKQKKKPNSFYTQRFQVIDDLPIPELQECPDWVQLFNRNSFSVEEQDWILFIDEVVPNSNDKEGWKKFNEDTDNRQYARELLEYLSDARSDTFIKILKYREWFKERVWYLALIYNKKVLKRIENPSFEDKLILYYFYE